MKAEDLDVPVLKTEMPFPEGLRSLIGHFTQCQIRRRACVYLTDRFLPIPGEHYEISQDALTIPHPIRTLDIVTVIFAGLDERWYYSHKDGWGRL